MPKVSTLLKTNAGIVTLIKPQFEAERNEIGRGGLVSDPAVHERVVEKIKHGMAELGFEMQGVIESPILGAASGNKEFVAYFKR